MQSMIGIDRGAAIYRHYHSSTRTRTSTGRYDHEESIPGTRMIDTRVLKTRTYPTLLVLES